MPDVLPAARPGASTRSPGFRHRVATNAASGALRDLLEHHGLSFGAEPLAEGTVFGLAGSMTLRVRVAAAAVPAIDIDGRAGALEDHLCLHLGLGADLVRTDDPAVAWDRLRAGLDAGRPVLLRVDVAELDYAPADGHDTRHVVVALGYDPRAQTVVLADPRLAELQTCSLATLARARAASAWPSAVRHAQLTVEDGERLARPRSAVTAALRRTVRTMRRPEPALHPNLHVGLAAADALAEAWPALHEMTGPRLGGTLSALAARIGDRDAGGTLHRSQQARFLHDAAALLGRESLGHAALVCDDLADTWRALAGVLADADAERAHLVAAPWIQRVRSLEHRHVEALEACLRDVER